MTFRLLAAVAISTLPMSALARTPVSPAEQAAAQSSDDTVGTFPAAYLGRWDLTAARCRSDDSGSAITVYAHEIRGYEDTSTLVTIEMLDEQSIRIVVDNESAEREVTLVQTLRISTAPRVSLRIETRGRTVRYVKCDGLPRQAG